MTRLEGVVAGYCAAEDHQGYGAEPDDCILIDGKEICLYCLVAAADSYLMFREERLLQSGQEAD